MSKAHQSESIQELESLTKELHQIRGAVREGDTHNLTDIVTRINCINSRATVEMNERQRENSEAVFISAPGDGGLLPVPAGRTQLNPLTGFATLSNGEKAQMNSSFKALDIDNVKSVMLYVDQPAMVSVNENPFLWLDQVGWNFIRGKITKISTNSIYPLALTAVFSTGSEPAFSTAVSTSVRRFAKEDSVAAWQPITFAPMSLDFSQGLRTSITDLAGPGGGMGDQSTAIASLSRAPTKIISTTNCGGKAFVIHNLDTANSIDINLQGWLVEGIGRPANDDTTGASLALAADSAQVLDVTKVWGVMRMRVQDTVANSSANFEVQFLGHIGTGE